MTAETAVLLAAAGFGAGAVNAVAGGGSLISFPALLAAGYPSVAANVTNSIALLPGYVGGSFAYREELGVQRERVRRLAPTSALGAAAGAALLLVSPASVFRALVPWLILAACLLLALQPRAAALARRSHRAGSPVVLHGALFATTLYGGYFGAGLGIILLALLGTLLPDDLQRLNALKGVTSLLVAIVSAVGFALFGPIAWSAALLVAAGAALGGVAGVRVARRLPAPLLRGVVIAYGVVVAITLLV
ncbi:MAG TPA: sulfite exporter TauE/SafE family protein [Solirubrobacteraceae bacterium]|nr:sulfite exporter TauE/SafE family protein [Solirubrobacteraceae bacterium]